MQIFSASLFAQRTERVKKLYGISYTVKCYMTTISIKAMNKDEALGMALRACKETEFPLTEGYNSHEALVSQVPHEWLIEYASQFQFKAP